MLPSLLLGALCAAAVVVAPTVVDAAEPGPGGRPPADDGPNAPWLDSAAQRPPAGEPLERPAPLTAGDDSPTGVHPLIAHATELDWHPKEALPAGAFGAVAHGDPQAGAYAFYGRFPQRFVVPEHWHSHDVDVVVLQGVMRIEPAGEPPVTLAPTEYMRLPARLAYTARCDEGCLFLAWGTEPFDIHYIHPEDDPRASRLLR